MSRAKETSVIKEGIEVRLKRGLNNSIGGGTSVQACKVKGTCQVIRDIN